VIDGHSLVSYLRKVVDHRDASWLSDFLNDTDEYDAREVHNMIRRMVLIKLSNVSIPVQVPVKPRHGCTHAKYSSLGNLPPICN
jgi:hypothetical protein